MDFTAIGSLNTYLKNLGHKAEWKQRQETGAKHAKSLDEWIKESTKPKQSAPEAQSDTKLQDIQTKLYNGKKLSPSEKEYLQEKDPVAYEKAKAIEQEQKSYENALKRCRTKEDVQRLRMTHLSASLTAVNAIQNNPHISKAKKLEFISLENGRVAALENIAKRFIKHGLYEKLPTEAELAKVEQAEAEKIPVMPPEQEQDSELVKNAEQVKGTVQDTEPVQDNVQTPPIAEEQEIEKVKRSKAQVAYAQFGEAPEVEVAKSLDLQV